MRYLMRQKFWAWGDDYTIKDDNERDVYLIDGRAFSFGKKLSFQDAQGRELAFIAQKLLAWGPTYEITREGQLLAVVRKDLFSFLRCQFTVDVPGPNDPVAEGDFLDHEYTFSLAGRAIAQVSKRWFSWTDTYGIDLAPDADPVLILCSAVVIDLVCHNDDR